MLTKNIVSEFGARTFRRNGLGPGHIATPQTAPLREPGNPFDAFIKVRTPAGRWGTVEDLMGPAVFLASDASNFVNGQILYVDGGILAYLGVRIDGFAVKLRTFYEHLYIKVMRQYNFTRQYGIL